MKQLSCSQKMITLTKKKETKIEERLNSGEGKVLLLIFT